MSTKQITAIQTAIATLLMGVLGGTVTPENFVAALVSKGFDSRTAHEYLAQGCHTAEIALGL